MKNVTHGKKGMLNRETKNVTKLHRNQGNTMDIQKLSKSGAYPILSCVKKTVIKIRLVFISCII